MTDLHTHCLPNIDDGAKTPEESIKMLSESFRQGVRLCAATPHCTIHDNMDIKRFLKKREESFNILKKSLNEASCETPEIIYGAEIFVDNDISNYSDIERLCIGNSDKLLVEFPVTTYRSVYAEWIYKLNLRGMVPIIAHLDRYPFFSDITREFREINVIYQLNAKRMLSLRGRHIIKSVLKCGKNCVVSSDMHDTGKRRTRMGDAYAKARKFFPELAESMFNAELSRQNDEFFADEKSRGL